MGVHQVKKLMHCKGAINKVKREPAEWEKIHATAQQIEGQYPEFTKNKTQTHKELSDNQNKNNLVKKWAKGINRYFS